jgi:hypothetical protein
MPQREKSANNAVRLYGIEARFAFGVIKSLVGVLCDVERIDDDGSFWLTKLRDDSGDSDIHAYHFFDSSARTFLGHCYASDATGIVHEMELSPALAAIIVKRLEALLGKLKTSCPGYNGYGNG